MELFNCIFHKTCYFGRIFFNNPIYRFSSCAIIISSSGIGEHHLIKFINMIVEMRTTK